MNLDAIDVLTVEQAAEILGVHSETVRRLARAGELPATKVGRHWRFRRQALERWFHRQTVGAGRRVLIVDDDAAMCAALTRMLAPLGVTTVEHTDAREALALALREPPALILLDLKMPTLSGPRFLAALRERHPELPVIIVTGYPDSELMQQAMAHAPLLLLAKPVEPALLQRSVRAVLGGRAERAVADPAPAMVTGP
jgi:excisionase family DNA binding protein